MKKEIPNVDWRKGARVGLVGGSYGGYLAMRVLKDHDPGRDGFSYAAAVVHAGIYDVINYYYTADAYWVQEDNFSPSAGETLASPDRSDAAGKQQPPWENWNELKQVSPIAGSSSVSYPPTLISHGLYDLRVPWTQSLLLHRFLQSRGGTSRLLLFPLLGHRIDLPQANVQWWNETLAWLREHLSDEQSP